MDIGEVKGQVDFGVLTIREDEFRAVLNRLPKRSIIEGRRRYRIRQLSLPSGEDYTIAIVRCAEQGNTDALNTARDLLEDLDPCFLLVVGIAGGVPSSEFTLGDVIVSTRIVDFSVEAVLKDHRREYALGGGPLHPDAVRLATDITAMVSDGELGNWNVRDMIGMDYPAVAIADTNFYGDNDWQKDTRTNLNRHFAGETPRLPLVVTSAIASSDRLFKEAETLQVWLKIARQIQAVEMESAGVYKAAHGRGVPFLAIRGISDIVGFKRHPDWTTYACKSAAAFMRSFLLTRPIPPRGVAVRNDLAVLRCGHCEIGPLTLSARLKAPADQAGPDAYPTGSGGAHFVFDLYNPNRVDFAVLAIEVEVLSYQPIDLDHLSHGVGATDITRRFQARVEPASGRYRATYVNAERPAEYAKILSGKDDRFDVAIMATTEGLYELRVLVVGTLAGSRFDASIEATRKRVMFFNRDSNHMVDRGHGERCMSYPEYIKEMLKYDIGGNLGEYSMLDSAVGRPTQQ